MDTNDDELNNKKEYEEFKKYLEEEREEILKYKWIRSEQEGRDLGQEAVTEWINKYAAEHRRSHEK